TIAMLLLAAALLGAAARPANARDDAGDEARFAERPTAIGVNAGVASAVGELGLTLTRALDRGVRVEAGAGLSLSGWQLSLMPQLALLEGRHHLLFGAGVAISVPYYDEGSTRDAIWWLNLDALGYERRFTNGVGISFALGIFYGLGGGTFCKVPICTENIQPVPARGEWAPQTRMQLAYWF
ncbi:MAG TPA: hypothetical protein VIQ54_08400, partial [Polyangia bacterium]